METIPGQRVYDLTNTCKIFVIWRVFSIPIEEVLDGKTLGVKLGFFGLQKEVVSVSDT